MNALIIIIHDVASKNFILFKGLYIEELKIKKNKFLLSEKESWIFGFL